MNSNINRLPNKTNYCHPAESDVDCAPDTMLYTHNLLHWNADIDTPNESEDDWEAHNESDIELDNRIKDHECPEQQDCSVAPNISGSVWPT